MAIRDFNDTAYIEEAVKQACQCGIIQDVRRELPRNGNWPKQRSVKDIIGICLHQNGSNNFKNYKGTARYHTSQENHITNGIPMATTVYDFMIPDIPKRPALLTADILDYKYAQGSGKHPGDENRHLISILVMGGFAGSGYRGYAASPSSLQLKNLDRLVDWLQHVFSFDAEGLFGHSNFGKAACPGFWSDVWIGQRQTDAKPDSLDTPEQWQKALMRWNSNALPKYGADGDWGGESKYWLSRFQRTMGIKVTGFQDTFTELLLLRETAQ